MSIHYQTNLINHLQDVRLSLTGVNFLDNMFHMRSRSDLLTVNYINFRHTNPKCTDDIECEIPSRFHEYKNTKNVRWSVSEIDNN